MNVIAPNMSSMVRLSDIEAARARVAGRVHKTPVLTSRSLNAAAGVDLYFKCENLQKTGSFKPRGALNAVLCALERGEPVPGLVTHSSGNHGQAVAWVARQLQPELPCTVVVPRGTPDIKCEAIRGYGANLVVCDPTPTARAATCEQIAGETGSKVIHPYDNYDVIAGQATIGLELHEQVDEALDAVLVPVSGGGMTSGVALATKYKAKNPNCKVIPVEPEGKCLEDSLAAKRRLWSNPPQFLNTIAEGIRTQQCGQLTFPILCDLIDPRNVVTVTDEDMRRGMKLAAQRLKIVIEASAGASLAAAMKIKEKHPEVRTVGVILCGGNANTDQMFN